MGFLQQKLVMQIFLMMFGRAISHLLVPCIIALVQYCKLSVGKLINARSIRSAFFKGLELAKRRCFISIVTSLREKIKQYFVILLLLFFS